MRTRFAFLFCMILLANMTFAQKKTPEYTKAYFVYEKKSNYYIDEKGAYADTLLLKAEFPNLKFSMVKHPVDSAKTIGFIPLDKFSREDKKELASSVYHTTELIEGVHDFKKNITQLTIRRDDANTKEVLNKYLDERYHKFKYKKTIDYNKQKIFIKFPSISHSKKFDTELKTIKFDANSKLWGYYREKHLNLLLDNFVLLKEGLDTKIVPGIIFPNNEFGVEKIATIHETIRLQSVTFE
ncbi:hypothetical protein [Flavobacterium microcysteis]